MSRIYEALQRADLERKTAQELEDRLVAEPGDVHDLEEPSQIKADFNIDDVLPQTWRPFSTSFPTLEERGGGVEQFRSLRSRIYQARYEAPLKTILVSSGMPAEGKSFVTANLAMSLARNGINHTLLIDGDLRRPTLHKLLGAPNTPGLSEYLSGTAKLQEVMQRDRNTRAVESASGGTVTNLTFIPAGKCGDNSSELVANHRIEELITVLTPHFDWILIDSPPVLAVTDAVELARAADAVLLVARGGSTPYDIARSAQAAFTNSRLLGFVINAVKEPPRSGSYYYYYYGGQETTAGSKRRKDKPRQG
ncbi:MAG: CpsD/CapB family tyrosine-protein kinase [Terracidiphilus sp.]|jgi:capsular exopolysaccharide synthesis family protein